jgi:hypothetical protein
MISAQCALLMMLAFTVKHFIVDFPLQKPVHYLNKGTYGHAGGIEHAGQHALGTLLILAFVLFSSAPELSGKALLLTLGLTTLDGFLHYHIDWAKMNLNRLTGWKPTDDEFWILLGVDQLLHYLTYIFIVWCYI